jgi:hypothetical protein
VTRAIVVRDFSEFKQAEVLLQWLMPSMLDNQALHAYLQLQHHSRLKPVDWISLRTGGMLIYPFRFATDQHLVHVPCPQFLSLADSRADSFAFEGFQVMVPDKQKGEWAIQWELRLALQNLEHHR